MLCPFCNCEMTKGKIIGDRYALKWSPDDKKLFMGIWATDSIILENNIVGIGRRYLEAYACDKCEKLIANIHFNKK